MPKDADFTISNQGSIVMFYPRSQDAHDWVDDNVGLEDWQWLGGGFACEHRMAGDLIEGIRDAGFVIA